ncbi:MAG TPA: MATE family efflux transporter [Candidatus Limnocylindria bacterium]|jgi:putative MATE family efflux protein|nr:MATE family efflux transporter [Candidatus Limnocylindria bacterium]
MSIEALEHRDAGAVLRRLATPTALAMVGDQLLGIVDTIVIGALGAGALAGITAAVGVFMVLGIGLFAFGSGLRIVGAQAIGAGQSERFGAIVRASAIAPLAIALLAALASLGGARPLLALIIPAGAPLDASAHYLMLRSFCLLPMVCSGLLIVAFATAGDAKLALRVLVVINAVHIPLVLVLALGVGTHHPFGLTGAGISSLVAELVGLAYAVRETARRPELRVFSSWRIDRRLVATTTSLSWPEFVFLVLQIVPEPITIALLAPSGTEIVAAFRALSLVSDATWSLPGSLGDASEVVLGQRIGARDYVGAKIFQREATRLSVAVSTAVGLAVAATAWPLAALCTLNPALATLAAAPLGVHVGVTLPLKSYAMTILAPIRASGDTRFVMIMGIAMTGVAMALITLGIRTLHLGLWAVPFGWTAAWLVRCAITAMRLKSGDWEHRRLKS